MKATEKMTEAACEAAPEIKRHYVARITQAASESDTPVDDKEVNGVTAVAALLVGFAALWMGLEGLSQEHNRAFAIMFLAASVFSFVSGVSGMYLKFDDVRQSGKDSGRKINPKL